jgi:hypothetical protein
VRLRDHPWWWGLGLATLVFAALLPLSHALPIADGESLLSSGWVLAAFFLGLIWVARIVRSLYLLVVEEDPGGVRRARRRAPTWLAVVCLVALWGAVRWDGALLRGLPRGAWRERFDAAAWQAPDPGRVQRRARMLGDVVERLVPRMSRDEARALLGPDDGPMFPVAEAGPLLVYVIGPSSWIDLTVLEIEYDSAGRYRGHRVRPHYQG